MAGILNPKERVLDTIITPTGRAQMSTGEMKIRYASFSDRQMYYSKKTEVELSDPGERIYFESYATDSDLIIQELDADANLNPVQTDTFTVYGGNVVSGSAQQGNVRLFSNALSADSINSLSRQMIIGTRNLLKSELASAFSITPSTGSFYFDYVAENASETQTILTASLNDVESLWQDYRVTNTPNYKFLPPQNLPLPNEVTGSVIGNYTKINQDPPQSYEAIQENLEGRQVQKFTFSNTRTANDILGQVFEISEKKLSKLVLIDGGEFHVAGAVNPRVFYAGKLYRDSRGSLTFINIFTLVFE
jgi:hypothetical protein